MASMNTITPAAAQTPSANTAAVCTLAAPTDGSRWTLFQLSYSYSGTPTGGSLVITWGSVSMTYYIPAGGPGWIDFGIQPMRFPTNTGVTITLAAGGSGVSGSVYAIAQTGN